MLNRSQLLWRVGVAFGLAALSGCSDDSLPMLEPQTWGDVQIEVETRPPLVEPGMNEFLVYATRGKRKPVFDLIVSLRVDEEERWFQAIQDGHVGVYRRAVSVPQPATATLHVRVQQGESATELHFPLAPVTAAASSAAQR